MEIQSLLNFLSLAEKLKCSTRHSCTSSGRHESVAEHSWRLCLMAYMVRDEFHGLDIEKVLHMCLFHDLGEAVLGDIPSFEKGSADEQAEERAVFSVLAALPEPHRSELTALFTEMNALETGEARLYKALDKLEAVIQHNEADISTWLPLEYELQLTYGVDECSRNPYLSRLRAAVQDVTQRKIEAAAE